VAIGFDREPDANHSADAHSPDPSKEEEEARDEEVPVAEELEGR
jgi:hypothetical protein